MAATPKFQRGDIVKLASGGPDMTVIGPEQYTGRIECVWFLYHDDSWEGPFEAAFYPELLQEA